MRIRIAGASRKLLTLFPLLALCVSCSKKQEPVVRPLTEQAVQEALDYGRKNAELSYDEFVRDWTVDLGYEQGKGRAILVTSFLRVALLGKQSAILDKEPDRKLVDLVLKEDLDTIHFRFSLYGDEPDFGRKLKFGLREDNVVQEPCYINLPRYGEFTRDYFNVAVGEVKFRREGIPPEAKVLLVVEFPGQAGKKLTAEFPFELNRYR